MTNKNVLSMIKYVRCILEENVNSVPLEGVTDVGSISINTVIESVLEKSVETVAKLAPMELFSNPKTVQYRNAQATGYQQFHAFTGGRNGGYISKPSDYMRMLVVECNGWERPVVELTQLSSPYVSIARSQINLSVGNNEKPLAVESFQGATGAIELYPLISTDTATLVYVERPKITGSGSSKVIPCDDGIYNAACFYAAHLVAMIKGYANAKSYQDSALDSLNTPVKNVNATSGAEVQQ